MEDDEELSQQGNQDLVAATASSRGLAAVPSKAISI